MPLALPRVLLALLLTAALAVLALPLRPAEAAVPAPDVEAALLASANAVRAAQGLPALQPDGGLAAGARSWSTQMAAAGVLSHDGSYTVLGAASWGENVGATSNLGDPAGALHAAFMASDAHRANILNPRFTLAGMGAVVAGGRVWVTQRFAEVAAAAPAQEDPVEPPAEEAEPLTEPEPQPEPQPEPDPQPEPEAGLEMTTAAVDDEVVAESSAAAETPQPAVAAQTQQAVRAAPAPAPARQPARRPAERPAAQEHKARTITPPAREHAPGSEPRAVGGSGQGPEQAQGAERRRP